MDILQRGEAGGDFVKDQLVIKKLAGKVIYSSRSDILIFHAFVVMDALQIKQFIIKLTPSQDDAKRRLELLANRKAEMPSVGGSATGTPKSFIPIID